MILKRIRKNQRVIWISLWAAITITLAEVFGGYVAFKFNMKNYKEDFNHSMVERVSISSSESIRHPLSVNPFAKASSIMIMFLRSNGPLYIMTFGYMWILTIVELGCITASQISTD